MEALRKKIEKEEKFELIPRGGKIIIKPKTEMSREELEAICSKFREEGIECEVESE